MSEPSREEVKTLIADMRRADKGCSSRALADNCSQAAKVISSLLALAYDKDTGEKYIERAAISEELRKEALSRLAEVEKALGNIAEQKLSSEMDEDAREYADWEGGFEECIRVARAALHPKGE